MAEPTCYLRSVARERVKGVSAMGLTPASEESPADARACVALPRWVGSVGATDRPEPRTSYVSTGRAEKSVGGRGRLAMADGAAGRVALAASRPVRDTAGVRS